MKKNITLLLLLAFCLFFLCQSETVSTGLVVFFNQNHNTFTLSSWEFLSPNKEIKNLHVIFVLIWSGFFLLLFNILSKNLNLFYSFVITVILLPAFLFQGVINTHVFDLLFILILIIGVLKGNKWSKKIRVLLPLIAGFFWLLLSNHSPFLMHESLLNSSLFNSLLNNNVMVWYHVLLLFLSVILIFSLDIDKKNRFKALVMLLIILIYSLFFSNSSVLFSISIIIPILVIKQQTLFSTLNKRLIIVSMYILIPFGLSGMYNRTYNHNSWSFGLNTTDQKIVDFTNKITFSGNVFNNKEAQLRANLFFKQGKTFFNNPSREEKQDHLFNQLIINPSQWNQYSIEKNINLIYFSLVNQPQEVLYFLGERLNSGNWTIVYEEKEKRVILMKRNQENERLINQFEQFPSQN